MTPTLVFQSQPTNNSCVCTCLAMLLGIPAQQAIDKWQEKYFSTGISLRDILFELNLRFKEYKTLDTNSFETGGFSFLTTPSLNGKGDWHQVLVEYSTKDIGWVLYDPQCGTGNAFYVPNVPEYKNIDNSYPLRSYLVDCFISYENLELWKRLGKAL